MEQIGTVGDLIRELIRIHRIAEKTVTEMSAEQLSAEFNIGPCTIYMPGEVVAQYRTRLIRELRLQDSVRRLDLLCDAGGHEFNLDTIMRFQAHVCISTGNTEEQVNNLPIDEFVAILRPPEPRVPPGPSQSAEGDTRRQRRSTRNGDAQAKIESALLKHHKYLGDSLLNPDPIGVNELSTKAVVSSSTVSNFFKRHFTGHSKYMALCRDKSGLLTALKILAGDVSPSILFNNMGELSDEIEYDRRLT